MRSMKSAAQIFQGYNGSLAEVASAAKKYQDDILPEVRGISKGIREIKRSELEATILKNIDEHDAQFPSVEQNIEQAIDTYHTNAELQKSYLSTVTQDDYEINKSLKRIDEEDASPSHSEIEERVRDSKYKNMGVPFGTGRLNSAKKNEFWNNVLSKMGSYFALTTATYSLA